MTTAKPLRWIGALVMLAGLGGCGEKLIGDPEDLPPGYLPQTSPENVLHNLQASYEHRDIEQYAKLLDPVYIRNFQSGDIPDGLERNYWTRDEDSTMVAALFDNPDVWGINLNLGPFVAEDSGLADAPGARRIRLTRATLEVELSSNTTLVAQGDILDMYFQRGRVGAGTDSTKWYIFEWRDFGGEWSSFLPEVGK